MRLRLEAFDHSQIQYVFGKSVVV